MKSDVVLGLQSANWPVLLVNSAVLIQNANAMAGEVFGSAATAASAPLNAIWSPENTNTPAQFLSIWLAAPTPSVRVKLRAATGVVVPYLASVCVLSEGDQDFYLLQFFPDKSAADGKTSVDSGQAHKQKLDCALQLAPTVSLDFNNALTSILGHTSLVLSKMEPNNPWRKSLVEVEKSAAKAAEIANDLGAFSRNEKESRVQQSGNLNHLLQRNVETFQGMKLDHEVSWSLQLERKLHTAKFDEAKMQQALVKIMENAVESLGANGRVIIQTKNLELTQPTQDRNAQLAAGTYICAEITDNGSGIDAETLPRIFEPFFTTKRGTKHRGLGLAWVYGIVTNHGGGVAVSSQPGVGTSVRVYLPSDKKIVADSSATTTDLNGTETILIVDDEDLVLTMGQAILSHYGYRVLIANSGLKALEIFSQNQQIELLITDLVMPNMSGRELVEQVRRVSPFTRIICSSGYVRPANETHDSVAYLQKPFTSHELLVKVKQALTSGEPAPVDG